ncbi:phosphogluconate dehydratase [Klebsiella michiganensis]|uniref:Phosphogluconate dehydratase n=1 Tax=Klebsiella michiganensis TaxID=1134687 RepID=A0A7H4MWF5_9ENTR|nr:phosphogluconate dehydratase [Klebsiella michiganensis]
MKTSAVPVENQIIEAPAVVFESQHDVLPAFEAGLLDKDAWLSSVIRGQKRTACQNYINLCRHLVYYWTAVSKLRW